MDKCVWNWNDPVSTSVCVSVGDFNPGVLRIIIESHMSCPDENGKILTINFDGILSGSYNISHTNTTNGKIESSTHELFKPAFYVLAILLIMGEC